MQRTYVLQLLFADFQPEISFPNNNSEIQHITTKAGTELIKLKNRSSFKFS